MTSVSSKFIQSLLASVELHCRKDPSRPLPSELYIGLYSVFGNLLAAALEILDRQGVIVFSARDSGRKVAVVAGSSGLRYTLSLRGQHCPCPAYQYTVMGGRGASHCKHMLALRLGLAMDRVNCEIVEDERVKLLLEEMFS